ncbi:hypothetical protein pb186bvf_008766 [Paramecium bursaria]
MYKINSHQISEIKRNSFISFLEFIYRKFLNSHKQIKIMNQVVPKEIQMEFYRMSKKQLQQIYDSLDQDVELTNKVLNKFNNSDQIDKLNELIQSSVTHRQYLLQMIRALKFHDLKKIIKGQITLDQYINGGLTQQNDQQEIIPSDISLLQLPTYTLIKIFDFIDIVALQNLRFVCSKFNILCTDPDKSDQLYKKYCDSLFTKQRLLPFESPFKQLTNFVNHNLHLFQNNNNIVFEANVNPQLFVWQNVDLEQIDYEQLKLKYSSFREMYNKQPRINYCGLYAMKESYIKRGEADFSQTYAPCHIIEFYRYTRFWQDGSVTMMLTNKKPNKEQLFNFFSQQIFINKNQEVDDRFLQGEYIIRGDQIFIKTTRRCSIFTFQLQIKTNKKVSPYPCNILQVVSAKLHDITDEYATNLYNQDRKHVMYYKHYEEMRKQLEQDDKNWKNIVQ